MNLESKIQRNHTEKEYRKIPKLSYSALKDFVHDRRKFYKKYVLGEKVMEEESDGMKMGSLVDCLLLHDDFDAKFAISTAIPPSGQMLDLVNNLYSFTVKCMDEEGQVTRNIQDLLNDAYLRTSYNSKGEAVAFKGKSFEKVVEMFNGSDAELYYKQLRANYGKTVVTLYDVENAEKIVNELKLNENTAWIFNSIDSEEQETHNQLPIEFSYREHELKMLGDRFLINHKERWIQPWDLKVTSSIESWGYVYLKFYYYIQATLYRVGIGVLAEKMGWGDYEVRPMDFIVADNINYCKPIIYKTTEEDFEKGLMGFSVKGRRYMGVEEALDQITWHTETGIWNQSFTEFQNKGIKHLTLGYDN